jgi:hypothetical protein
MKYFLLVYDRRTQRLLEQREYSEQDAERAATDRLDREIKFSSEPEVEVVVLGSDSIETVKRTHARYFRTFSELIGDLSAAVRG